LCVLRDFLSRWVKKKIMSKYKKFKIVIARNKISLNSNENLYWNIFKIIKYRFNLSKKIKSLIKRRIFKNYNAKSFPSNLYAYPHVFEFSIEKTRKKVYLYFIHNINTIRNLIIIWITVMRKYYIKYFMINPRISESYCSNNFLYFIISIFVTIFLMSQKCNIFCL